MDGRIGSLEVRYRAAVIDPLLAARLPALTRALELQLAGALDAGLTAAIGGGRDVYVLRELHVRATLDDAWMLDRPVVDRLSAASVDAVSAALARPTDDVRHFSDQADFLSAFIADELDGAAAGRWYFGAFAPYRRADAVATIAAVLAAHPAEVPATLSRLARRGRLDDLLARLGAGRLLDLVRDGEETTRSPSDVAVLVDAAIDLVRRAGWPVPDGDRPLIRRALLQRHADAAPAWTDRRVLSEFVWTCVSDAVEMLRGRGAARGPADRAALVQALHGRLDWLDGPWLLDRLAGDFGDGDGNASTAPPNRLAIVLGRIAQEVAAGRVALPAAAGRDDVLVRLIAAAHLGAEDGVSAAALRAALVAAIDEWQRLAGPSGRATTRPEHDRRTPDPVSLPSRRVPRARDANGPEAASRELARALADRAAAVAGAGVPTAGAGLYLLSRAVLDAGLPGLAAAHAVPLPPLLAQLATRWLELSWPLDGPARDWTGAAESDDDIAPGRLDGAAEGLAALAEALRERLIGQGVVAAASDATEGESSLPARSADHGHAAVDPIDAIAALLMRGWARWLPGLRDASAAFLLAQCLRRAGAVRRSDTAIDVTLDPAPLDVVLQMAGYLQPIAALPWCGGRAVTFSIRRQPSA